MVCTILEFVVFTILEFVPIGTSIILKILKKFLQVLFILFLFGQKLILAGKMSASIDVLSINTCRHFVAP